MVEHVVLDVMFGLLTSGKVGHNKRVAVSSSSYRPIRVTVHRDNSCVDSRVNLFSGWSQLVVGCTSVLHHEPSDSHDLFILTLKRVSSEALRVVSRDETSVVVSFSEGFVLKDGLTKAQVVSHSINHVLVQSQVEEVHGSGSIFAPSDSFGDHRVVINRYF